ncbi:hypothetical protein OUZ56_012326 [Daphnia magna]|uniref:Galactosyltransferase N-terminal domain-containing protein n=1 Tax=Daphnia magna TaxID=35525 RepID=A0ABQ9Z2V0_9CRUS|nr:hypothetical protein OUZ56_012326 [Daphnia magna]
MCPLISPLLVGWIDVSKAVNYIRMEQKATTTNKLRKATTLRPGGKYQPSDCQSRNKVAIVVPYRERRDHLTIFLSFMHPFLQRQQLEYTIFVVEQSVCILADAYCYKRQLRNKRSSFYDLWCESSMPIH